MKEQMSNCLEGQLENIRGLNLKEGLRQDKN